ncbi:MAG: hypothetical protein PHN60_01910 [Candidatus Gracilibacteria bacterium]|nr:hypothetical protein [Candidatus Gracilibacteria bacterium]
MKIFFTSILVIFMGIVSSLFFVFANGSVGVSAVVGSLNHSPTIITLTPSSDPKLLGTSKIQNYTLYFRDDEKDTVYYTITPVNGYANPISGTVNLSDYDSGSGAYVNFTYLSPATIPTGNLTTVTVTLNDGPNLVNKDIHLYIY